MPLSVEARTMRSATGSPPSSRRLVSVMSAPISRSVRKIPARSGFMPTPVMVTAEPGTRSAAMAGKAAELGSPGTTTGAAVSSGWPTNSISTPSPSGVTPTVAPKWRSMFSVWSRVASGSTTLVTPRAQRPASRQADFTWAEGTGTR